MTEQQWQKLLDAEPADGQRRLEFSDWLEDQGRGAEAAVQRWLARARRWPNRSHTDATWYQEANVQEVCFDWWHGDVEFLRQLQVVQAALPAGLFDRLADGTAVARGSVRWREYPTRTAAEEDLALAWRKLEEDGGPLP